MNNSDDKNIKIENENIDKNEENTNEKLENNENNDLDHDEKENEIVSKEDELVEQIAQLRDEKLRLLAEMDNLRKRADRDKIDSIRYGSFNLARDMLSPDDNLTRALEAIPNETEKNSDTFTNLIDGLKMVQKEFSSILEKHGIKKIDAMNNKFDHNFHQAMVEIENDEIEPGTVIQEMQRGYTMHDRLLRPSLVAVSKKSSDKDLKSEENQAQSEDK